MMYYATNNCSNSSAKESCRAAFIVRANRVITGRLKKNVDGILVTEIDTDKKYYDSTRYWRSRAMNGIRHSGRMPVPATGMGCKGITEKDRFVIPSHLQF